MRVYLVYGLTRNDSRKEPFVIKIFYEEQDAKDYAFKCILNNTLDSWFIEEIEVE